MHFIAKNACTDSADIFSFAGFSTNALPAAVFETLLVLSSLKTFEAALAVAGTLPLLAQ